MRCGGDHPPHVASGSIGNDISQMVQPYSPTGRRTRDSLT